MSVKNHRKQSNMGEKGIFGLCFCTTFHPQWKIGQEIKKGRNLQAVADEETM